VKQLMRLLIVALIAGAVATIIVQRDRLRQMDRERLAAQMRELVQSVIDGGKEAVEEATEAAGEAPGASSG
jgi:hypothetical protein